MPNPYKVDAHGTTCAMLLAKVKPVLPNGWFHDRLSEVVFLEDNPRFLARNILLFGKVHHENPTMVMVEHQGDEFYLRDLNPSLDGEPDGIIEEFRSFLPPPSAVPKAKFCN